MSTIEDAIAGFTPETDLSVILSVLDLVATEPRAVVRTKYLDALATATGRTSRADRKDAKETVEWAIRVAKAEAKNKSSGPKVAMEAPSLEESLEAGDFLPLLVSIYDYHSEDAERAPEIARIQAAAVEAGQADPFARDLADAPERYQALCILREAILASGRSDVLVGYDASLWKESEGGLTFRIFPPIIPGARGGKGDGKGWTLRFQTEGPEKEFIDVYLSFVDLATGNVKPLADLGIGITQRAAQPAYDVLIKLAPPVLPLAEKPGWQGDGYDLFVWGDTALAPDGTTSEIMVPLAKPRVTKGTQDTWKQEVAARAVGNHGFAASILSGLMAPAKPVVDLPSGGENIHGDTRGGKTTRCFGALSVWEPPTGKLKYDSTPAGLERALIERNNRYVLMDGTENTADVGRVQQYQYLIGDGQTKNMAGSSGDLSTREPISFNVEVGSTGEKSNDALFSEEGLTIKDGAESRMPNIPHVMTVEHGRKTPVQFAEDYTRACANNFGTAGEAIVLWLMKLANREKLIERYSTVRDEFLERARQQVDRTDGQEAAFLSRCALKVAIGEAAVSTGILPWAPDYPAVVIETEYQQWLAGRGGHGSTVALRTINTAAGFIETYPIKFEWRPAREQKFPQVTQERLGYRQSVKHFGRAFDEIVIVGDNLVAINKLFGTSEITAALVELERRTIDAIKRYLELSTIDRLQFDFPAMMIWTPRVSKVAKGNKPLETDRGQKVGRWGTKSIVLLVAGSEQEPAAGDWDEAPAAQDLNAEEVPSHR